MKKNNLLYSPDHPQCRAALIALRETYPKPWEQWLEFRMELLTRWEKERGGLTCHYCGAKNLHKITENVPPSKQATLDHIKPRSKGGAEYDEDNLVVACRICNEEKADKEL